MHLHIWRYIQGNDVCFKSEDVMIILELFQVVKPLPLIDKASVPGGNMHAVFSNP